MLGDIFKMYAARCKKAGAMDFDDLLLNTVILFRDFPDVLRIYQEKFHFILVDEYQDTNYAQYLIVNHLGARHKNVCVVGDDAQSIYSFRGAKIENILNFKNDYPECRVFKLERNYRSTQTIVNAGNSIIDKNRDQIRKTIYSKNEEGEKISVIKALTDVEEGFIVSNSILDIRLTEQMQYNNFAILYRTNAQSRIFEEALRKRNIPYRIYGSISFYQRKEIKDSIAYLRLLVNPNDDEALKRIINYPARGIGKTTMGKLEEASVNKNISLWELLQNLSDPQLKLNRGTNDKLLAFVNFIDHCKVKAMEEDAYETARYVIATSGIMKELHTGNTPEELSKYENLEELLNGIRDFVENALEEGEQPSLDRYLQNVALLTDANDEKEEKKDKVSIMTMHSAKGLEFEVVYISGVEEELFPSPMAFDSRQEMEEERRLFYVAVTRAKKKVIITYSQSRYRWGELMHCSPSRFIEEIDETYIDWSDDPRKDAFIFDKEDAVQGNYSPQHESITFFNRSGKKLTKISKAITGARQTSVPDDPLFKPSDPMEIQTGMLVEHTRFGKGKVIHIEGEMPNRKATVFFQQMKQEKHLLLKFAKLKIVDNF